jgi:Ca2+-binding RTX toxin-like protein
MKKPLMVVTSTVLALLASFVPMSSANAADPVCTINITESNIEVQGTNLGDVICITGDFNTVYSLGGDDTVVDDGIANTIFLGEGFDSYYGSGGSGSTVDGGPGDDEITGTPGPDEITGGDGDDKLIGGEEDDTLNGGLGADELAGNAGDDNLFGESGSDSLSGGDGDDILAGGDDIDTLAGGVGLNVCDYNTGEALTSTCRYDDAAPVISGVSFSPSVVDVGSEAQTVELTMSVSDGTGVSDLSLSCNNEEAGYSLGAYLGNGGTHGGSYFSSIGNWQADITGDPTQLTAKFKIVVPLGIRPGVFRCSTYTTDKLANRDGWKSISQTLTVFRTPAGQPSSPRNLGFISTSPTAGVMSWMDPEVVGNPALVGYVMEYSRDGESWLTLPKSGTKSTSLDVSGLMADTDYWFRVRGENGGTVGQDTTYMNLNWATIKIRTPAPVVADSPTSLVVSNITSSGYKLAWSAPASNGGAAITDFKVEVSSDGGNTWKLAKQYASTSLSLNVSGAAPGTNYLVRVGAINSVGVSEYLTGSLKTASTAPRTPRDVSSSKVSGTSLTLSWLLPSSNGGSAITDYKVEVSSNCATYTVINRPVSVNLGFNVTGLKPGTKYCFRVSAGNDIGYSSPTQAFVVSTPGYPPAAPTSLSVKASKTSVTLGWKAAAVNGGSAVKNYIVEYSKNYGYTWIRVKKPVSTSRTLIITGLKNTTTYLFRVIAVNDAGNSAASKNLKVVTLYSGRR